MDLCMGNLINSEKDLIKLFENEHLYFKDK